MVAPSVYRASHAYSYVETEQRSFVFEFVGVCRTSGNGDECGIKFERTLDVG
jgi:hypothetical protein